MKSCEQTPSAGLFPDRRPIRPLAPDEFGNYDSPALALLRDIWNEFLDGEVDEAAVVGIIHQVGVSLEQHIDALQIQVDGGRSDVYDPAFAEIASAFMAHLRAVESMAREFEQDPKSPHYKNYFELGYERAQKATNRLMGSHNRVLDSL